MAPVEALIVLGLSSLCARAQAHDAPQVFRIVWHTRGEGVLLQTNRGLIFGDTERGPWRLMCNDALPVTSNERPSLTYAGDGRLLIATSRGLKVSADGGCSWQVLAFDDRLVPALAAHPAQPDRVYVSTFLRGAASPETSGKSAIQVSDDGGASFRALRVVPDNDYIHSLAIAPSEPDRVYAAGAVYENGRAFYVLRSDDAGESFERFGVEIEDDELDLLLLGVSPVDPDLVLAKVAAGEPERMQERLLLSRDGGESFESPTAILKLRAAAFSADGATLWLAGGEGLYRASGDFSAFERVGAAEEMTCAVEHDGVLLACGWHNGLAAGARNNGIGSSRDSGDSFEPWMTFQDVLEPIACEPQAATPALCEQLWSDWQYEVTRMFGPNSLRGSVSADAGTPEAGGDDAGDAAAPAADQPAERGASAGCGFLRARGEDRLGGLALIGFALCAARRRRA